MFLGFTPLLLAFLAWRMRPRGQAATEPEEQRALNAGQVVALYALVTVVGYLLTLGPRIRLSETLALPSPYMLLLQLPGFSSLRVPARFLLLAVTGTAILGAWALSVWSRRLERVRYLGVLGFVAACLALELLPYNARSDWSRPANSYLILGGRPAGVAPINNEEPPVPRAAYKWLASQPPDAAVFNYPANSEANRQYMYQLRYHKHPMLNGQASFLPRWFSSVDWDAFPTPAMLKLLRDRNIRYVMVHNRFLTKDQQAGIATSLRTYLDSGWLAYVDRLDEVTIYRLLPIRPTRSVHLEFDKPVDGSGWQRPEVSSRGVSYTWTSAARATLDVLLQVERDLDLEFQVSHAISQELLDSLKVAVNGTPIAVKRFKNDLGYRYNGNVPRGVLETEDQAIQIAFETARPVSPLSLGRGSQDRRELGVAFDWVELRPHTNLLQVDFDSRLEGAGWHAPEQDTTGIPCRYMAEPVATVVVHPAGKGDLAVLFKTKEAPAPELLSSLTLAASGRVLRLSRTSEGAGAVYRCLIPEAVAALGGETLELTFRVERTVELTSGGKSRQVGAGIERLWIYPANDVRFELDSLPVGPGWHPSEVDALGVSFRWMARPTATLYVSLPSDQRVALQFRALRGVTEQILNSLTLAANDERVPLTYDNTTGEHIFRGVIPLAAVTRGDPSMVALNFTVKQVESQKTLGIGNDPRPLGVAIDWLELRPE
ncbi:MAG: hypothetical protein V1750_03245 [Acidobacteriota bacterium]